MLPTEFEHEIEIRNFDVERRARVEQLVATHGQSVPAVWVNEALARAPRVPCPAVQKVLVR